MPTCKAGQHYQMKMLKAFINAIDTTLIVFETKYFHHVLLKLTSNQNLPHNYKKRKNLKI